MQLSRTALPLLRAEGRPGVPTPDLLALPERVLQFGTGVLLRGLVDYFVDKANKAGVFNGRIVVVKSTARGDVDAFARQDNIYTLCVRGLEGGSKVDETIINGSISRVLSAAHDWKAVLECAADPALQLVVSNTTEVGIALVSDDVAATPPTSFPGKLLACLWERYRRLGGAPESGLVIVPTELISGNGAKLKSIVLELCRENHLPDSFLRWVDGANDFCNSLVDRIVPGRLSPADATAMKARLGYDDELLIMAEVYRLWAIETSRDRTRAILSFSQADHGVVVTTDIEKFKELKLRLLNGSHTFTCGLAVMAGIATVKQAMQAPAFAAFIGRLMVDEIVPAISGPGLPAAEARQFAANVLDRYRNPFLEHQWLSITLQYTNKMRLRNVPLIEQYYQKFGTVPQRMALGLAAWLLFMRSTEAAPGAHVGRAGGREYPITDDRAALLRELWGAGGSPVGRALGSTELWGTDLALLPGLVDAVERNLRLLEQRGPAAVLAELQQEERGDVRLTKE